MKLYYFSEMPHHEFPDAEGDKYPSLRLEFPNRFFDRNKAAENYRRYLTEYELADQVGFDGLMINEHHSTPSCVNVGVNMTAAVLGRTTARRSGRRSCCSATSCPSRTTRCGWPSSSRWLI